MLKWHAITRHHQARIIYIYDNSQCALGNRTNKINISQHKSLEVKTSFISYYTL